MIDETQKILILKLKSTHMRKSSSFVGHSESVYIETEKKIDEKKLINKIKKVDGLSLVDKKIDGGYVTPDEASGEDDVLLAAKV